MIQIDMDKPKTCWACPFVIVDGTLVKGLNCMASYRKGTGFAHFYTLEQAVQMYKNCPLREVKTGHWIKIGRWGRHFKCSNCGNMLDFSGVNAGRGDANCCPNCGSRNEVKTNGID